MHDAVELKIKGKSVPSGLAQRRDISIDDFEQMRVIGRGGFSRVILARKKDTGRLYAIKILRKDRLINENQIKPILSERRVLGECLEEGGDRVVGAVARDVLGPQALRDRLRRKARSMRDKAPLAASS